MTRLERRCRLLLRLYPAAYRAERGEEILGTLLETTPEHRSWPLVRDVRAIAIGGLRARCALNRRRTTAANVRVAVVVGVAAYLCLDAATWFHTTHVAKLCTAPFCTQFAGPPWLGPALIAAAVVLACTCRRRVVILCAVLPAAVLVWLDAGSTSYVLGAPEVVLPCLTVLVILAGGPQRPGIGWLLPLAAIAAGPWLIGPYAGPDLGVEIFVAFAVFSIAWIVVDAKPAIAAAVFLLMVWLSWSLYVPTVWASRTTPVVLGIVATVGGLAVWRLHRQSARQP